MKFLSRNLYFQVIIAIIIGILLGHFFPDIATYMKPLSDAFVKLIKLMVGPIIFCTIVIGFCAFTQAQSFGKMTGLALIYFEVLSTCALIIGLVFFDFFKPGSGLNVDIAHLDSKLIKGYTESASQLSMSDYFLNIIPSSFVNAFAQNELLQILFISIFFGLALKKMGATGTPVLSFIEKLNELLSSMLKWIMYIAPLAAFGAMAFTIGKFKIGALSQMFLFMMYFYLVCLVFIFVILGAVLSLHGFNIFKVLAQIKEELLIVLGTSSSESVLAQLIHKIQSMGVSKSAAGLIIPAGYSFNLDGTAIYLTAATLFLAQATNIDLTLMDQIVLIAIMMFTSKGAAGVTGSGFIVLAGTLAAWHKIPVESMVLILGVDRFMSEARALTNVIGNTSAALVISKWCGEFRHIKS